MAGFNTLIIRKKKSLDHLKRLSDGKDPSYEFWQRVIRYKIIINEYKTLIAAEYVDYIINRCERKAAAHLEADLSRGELHASKWCRRTKKRSIKEGKEKKGKNLATVDRYLHGKRSGVNSG